MIGTVLLLFLIGALLFLLMRGERSSSRRRVQPARGQQPGVPAVCAFCSKNQDDVRTIIAGPSVSICDECIDLCNDILAEKDDEAAAKRCMLCTYPKEPADVVLIQGRVLCLMCLDEIRTANANVKPGDGT